MGPVAFLEICVAIAAVAAVALSLRRSHLRAHPPRVSMPPGFEETAERIVDPVSGVVQAVWFNPQTGERRYQPLQPDARQDGR
jgi:hypothetical protein